MLRETRAKILGLRRLAVDFDDARAGGEPSQKTKTIALALASRIWLITEVGVLGLRVDRILRDSGAEGAEGFLTDLLGEVVEAIAHEAGPACHADRLRPTNGSSQD